MWRLPKAFFILLFASQYAWLQTKYVHVKCYFQEHLNPSYTHTQSMWAHTQPQNLGWHKQWIFFMAFPIEHCMFKSLQGVLNILQSCYLIGHIWFMAGNSQSSQGILSRSRQTKLTKLQLKNRRQFILSLKPLIKPEICICLLINMSP